MHKKFSPAFSKRRQIPKAEPLVAAVYKRQVRNSHGLAGGGIVSLRRVDLRYRIGASREGVGDLPLAVGGIGFVNPVSSHPELQARHYAVLALFDDFGRCV